MDRASDSGSEGWGFESLPAYQKIRGRLTSLPLIFSPSGREGLEQFDATVRWTVACRQLDGGNTNNFTATGYDFTALPLNCSKKRQKHPQNVPKNPKNADCFKGEFIAVKLLICRVWW